MTTPTYSVVENSTFLDAYASRQASAQQFADMANNPTLQTAQQVLGSLFTNSSGAASVATVDTCTSNATITVALVLDRMADPSALLSGNWAERQGVLGDGGNNGATWSTYGGNPCDYAAVTNYITTTQELGAGTLVGSDSGSGSAYVSSAESRTIWLSLDAAQFNFLFGSNLLTVTQAGASDGVLGWTGNLRLPSEIAGMIKGLWVDQGVTIPDPVPHETTLVDPTILADGWLGVGNGHTDLSATPAAIAANYDFPLSGDLAKVATSSIAVVELNFPVDQQAGLLANFNTYRQELNLPELAQDEFNYFALGPSATGSWEGASEFALDISVIAGAAPKSALNIYGLLPNDNPLATAFNAYQRVFFATGQDYSPIMSSSHPVLVQATAASPFLWAYQQLFVDGALANISSHLSAGDQGSSANIGNGLANVAISQSSPFSLAVGGTSIAGLYAAERDVTLQSQLAQALTGDTTMIFSLVEAGLKTLPANLSDKNPGDPADDVVSMFETVWQRLQFSPYGVDPFALEAPFGSNETGLGGIAHGVPVPGYQEAYGLDTLTDGWRGLPDVSALAGGDLRYAVLNADYVADSSSEPLIIPAAGTSAAAPLWAALTTQFNAIFADQGLPQLGYYNDLLYIASVIAPASFNDIQMGNNINSFYDVPYPTRYYNSNSGSYMIPTGQGYPAVPGYDLATGLGTPNGMLLARALTAIAHSQISFGTGHDMLDADGSGGWTSGTNQSLLFQTMSAGGAMVDVSLGSDDFSYTSGASQIFAWTAQLAEQSLQSDFDPDLVRLFDKYGQGLVVDSVADSGVGVSLSLNGTAADAIQATLSNAFGFADFMTDNGVVRVARAVAVAETAGAADNQTAVVRVRQNGQDNLTVTFYQVDDLAGTINGIAPGQADYAAAAQENAYSLSSGGKVLSGPGYGNFVQNTLVGVDAGDYVAMSLTNNSSGETYWAFSQANSDRQGHLWNYGLNTWGWEDTKNGGDHDFNDLVVQLDFTSASGNGWLIKG